MPPVFCPETDGQPGRRYGVNLSPWDREGRFLPAPVPLTCLRPQCLPARRHQRHRGGTSPVPVCPGSVSYIYSPGGRTGLGTVPAHWMRQGRALASCFPCPFWGTSPSCSRFVLWLESHSAAQAGLERTAPSCLSLPSAGLFCPRPPAPKHRPQGEAGSQLGAGPGLRVPPAPQLRRACTAPHTVASSRSGLRPGPCPGAGQDSGGPGSPIRVDPDFGATTEQLQLTYPFSRPNSAGHRGHAVALPPAFRAALLCRLLLALSRSQPHGAPARASLLHSPRPCTVSELGFRDAAQVGPELAAIRLPQPCLSLPQPPGVPGCQARTASLSRPEPPFPVHSPGPISVSMQTARARPSRSPGPQGPQHPQTGCHPSLRLGARWEHRHLPGVCGCSVCTFVLLRLFSLMCACV